MIFKFLLTLLLLPMLVWGNPYTQIPGGTAAPGDWIEIHRGNTTYWIDPIVLGTGGGAGDMYKITYDTDNDGQVDAVETIGEISPESIETALDAYYGSDAWRTGGGGGSALELQDEGSTVDDAVTHINFVGPNVVVTESADHEILVTISFTESDPVAGAALSTHTGTHPAPTNRDTRNQVAGSYLSSESDPVAGAALSTHTGTHPIPTTRDSRNQIAGTYLGTAHTSTHPVPTTRDTRNEPAAGNPAGDGYCYKSTAAGSRSWGLCSVGGVTDHDALNNLSYVASGHTGFQPAGSYLTSESDPVAGGALTSHTSTHPIPTSRDTRNQVAGSYLSSESDPVAGAALTTHQNTHPIPTSRDTRNQVAGSYEPADATILKDADIGGTVASQNDLRFHTPVDISGKQDVSATDGKLYFLKDGALQEATIAARVAADLAEAPLTSYQVVGYSVSGACVADIDTPSGTTGDKTTTLGSLTVWSNAVTAAGGNPNLNVSWRCVDKPDTFMGDAPYVASYGTAGGISAVGTAAMLGEASYVAVYGTTGDTVAVGNVTMLGQVAQVASYGTTGLISTAGIVDMLGQAAQVKSYGATGAITVGVSETDLPATITATLTAYRYQNAGTFDNMRTAAGTGTLPAAGGVPSNALGLFVGYYGEEDYYEFMRPVMRVKLPTFTGTPTELKVSYTFVNDNWYFPRANPDSYRISTTADPSTLTYLDYSVSEIHGATCSFTENVRVTCTIPIGASVIYTSGGYIGVKFRAVPYDFGTTDGSAGYAAHIANTNHATTGYRPLVTFSAE